MKLGIICSWENEKTFETVRKLGIGGTEFTVNNGVDSKKFLDGAEELKKTLAKYGLETYSVGRWGMTRVDDDGHIIPEALENDKNVILSAHKLGCPVFNCGCNYAKNLDLKDNFDVAADYFSKLIDFADDKGVKIAVYNCNWENFVISSREWDILLPALSKLGIKYDPSHSVEHTAGYDYYLGEMMKYGDRFYHFHAKGILTIDGVHYDDPPVGMDLISWGAVFDILYTKNYEGAVSYEPHSKYWNGRKGRWGVDFSVEYLKKFFIPEDYVGEMSSSYSL